MKIKNHKLVGNDGKLVPYDDTPNKSAGNIAPEFLIMHYTAGGTLKGAVNWFNNPGAKASAHLIIGHDGAIVQMGQFNRKLWHAGRSRYGNKTGFNSFSIGIEIVNWGKLSGKPGKWRSWTGTPIDDSRVVEATHKLDSKSTGWEIFDEVQIEIAVQAAAAICTEYGIDESRLIGHDDISGYRGKRDPGPVFDLDRFRGKVFGRQDDGDDKSGLFVVDAANGLNLRDGPGMEFNVKKTLNPGTLLSFAQADNVWWLVSEIDANSNEDETGWVHSRWVKPA